MYNEAEAARASVEPVEVNDNEIPDPIEVDCTGDTDSTSENEL